MEEIRNRIEKAIELKKDILRLQEIMHNVICISADDEKFFEKAENIMFELSDELDYTLDWYYPDLDDENEELELVPPTPPVMAPGFAIDFERNHLFLPMEVEIEGCPEVITIYYDGPIPEGPQLKPEVLFELEKRMEEVKKGNFISTEELIKRLRG